MYDMVGNGIVVTELDTISGEILDAKTFEDLREYGINCKTDKGCFKNLYTDETAHIFPQWILSAKKPKKCISFLRVNHEGGIAEPIIKFHWESEKLGISEDQVCMFYLKGEKNGYIPAIVSDISRSIYDTSWVEYFGDDGVSVQNLIMELLNSSIDKRRNAECLKLEEKL